MITRLLVFRFADRFVSENRTLNQNSSPLHPRQELVGHPRPRQVLDSDLLVSLPRNQSQTRQQSEEQSAVVQGQQYASIDLGFLIIPFPIVDEDADQASNLLDGGRIVLVLVLVFRGLAPLRICRMGVCLTLSFPITSRMGVIG
jgi:hypothetical protein